MATDAVAPMRHTSGVPRGGVASDARRGGDWRRDLTARLWLSDAVVLGAAVFTTQALWFGPTDQTVAVRDESPLASVPYVVFSLALIVAWMWALSLVDSRGDRVVGTGATEYARVVGASTRLFGAVAILAFLLRVDVARGYLLVAFPLGVALLVLSRWLWRGWLVRRRGEGEYCARVVLVGSAASVAQIADALERDRSAGYLVVGACLPGGRVGADVPGTTVPVLGDLEDTQIALRAAAADTVAITTTDDLPPSSVKRISWDLEAGRRHLVLAPGIVDVAGPRLRTRPVAGLPLIHVETPQYTRVQRIAKRATDLALAGFALVLLSPLLLIVAVVVATTTSGPVFFRQERVGLNGRRFRMLKFRTMVDGAEALQPALEGRDDLGNGVLFKMSDDPRVTDVGRFLRRFSIDELPQLWNVVAGDMSLVGPRPPLPREVARYEDHVHRRFLVKPGITGLWQVSGRSTLTWEESVRLDLFYVENWSLVGDLLILARTVRVAVRPGRTTS